MVKLVKLCARTTTEGDTESLYLTDILADFLVVRNSEINAISRKEAFKFCVDAGSRDTCEDYFPEMFTESYNQVIKNMNPNIF